MSFLRKVDYTGRITLPSELCEKFSIRKDDIVEITHNSSHILIKKYQPEFVCVVTGEITGQGRYIGNAFISDKGLKMIEESMKKRESMKEE
ncbi:MAG TPA: AbrB/MazE/SpoVT family DNA-binding domain-containing protein [Metabacillus sp.]|nr:AbrB/MazE/SpoVT family DNA-binding domain-containing protein [Metabacillus sp.]